MLKMSKGITAFTITVDVWLLYSQALSSLKIYEQVLNNQPLSEYAFSLFVLITSTAFSLLEFYRDNCSRRKYSTQRFSLKSLMSVLCAIFLFGGGFFSVTFSIQCSFFSTSFSYCICKSCFDYYSCTSSASVSPSCS